MADDKQYLEYQCEIDPSIIPGSGTNTRLPVLNPDYAPPTDRPPSPLQIRIFYTATDYKDFAPHWTDKNPLTIDDNEGVLPDLLEFTLEDVNYLVSNWPFDLQNGLRCQLVDTADDFLRFHGTIASLEPDVFLQRPEQPGEPGSLTDIKYVRVTVKDFTEALTYNPVTELYENVREGFYLSDMVGRFAPPLSNADMDPTLGELTGRYVVSLKFPSQELQSAMLRNDWVLWIERETLRVQLKRRTDAAASVPLIVTDQNVWNHFNIGTWRVNPVDAALANRVIMPWKKANRQGTVDVEQNTKLIYGTGCDFTDVKPGDTIRILGSQSTYTVDHATQVPQEVWITSEYQEADATAVAFEILSSVAPPPIQIDDIEHQEALAQLFPHLAELSGVRTFVAPEPAEPMTEEDAELVALQYLRIQVIEGGVETDTIKFPWPVQAGMGVEVNRYNYQGVLIFRKIRWTYWPSGRAKPVFKLQISFTDPIADIDRLIRALLHDRQKGLLQNDLVIREQKILYERALFGDCLQVIDAKPFESSLEASDAYQAEDATECSSTLEVSDSYDTAEMPAGPFYTSPTPRQAGYVAGFTNIARCS